MAKFHQLKASLKTCVWGYFDNSRPPVLNIEDGDIVEIETVSQHAGDAPDLMMDDAIREIYEGIPLEKRIPGVHILTGPIYVAGAEPGDALEVKVLDLWPRIPYGSNFSGFWGLLHKEMGQKEHVTIFKADLDSQLAKAEFSYPYWADSSLPGRIMEPEKAERKPCLNNICVPLRIHFGLAGVAPKENGMISSTPPGPFGGNIDNRNFISGTSMIYPVQVKGAHFVAGDAHLAQGDGEINGTAIEANVNGLIQFKLRKDIKLINNPVLITPTHYIVHGFHKDLNESFRQCALEAISFLEANKGLNKREAYALLSVHGDFQVTQVVDELKGVHCMIRRNIFI